jgi:hypothetical protein
MRCFAIILPITHRMIMDEIGWLWLFLSARLGWGATEKLGRRLGWFW